MQVIDSGHLGGNVEMRCPHIFCIEPLIGNLHIFEYWEMREMRPVLDDERDERITLRDDAITNIHSSARGFSVFERELVREARFATCGPKVAEHLLLDK